MDRIFERKFHLASEVTLYDLHWRWKVNLRTVLLVLNLGVIGCIMVPTHGTYVGAIFVAPCSIVWTFVTLGTLAKRKRPLRPSIDAGVDALLLLGYILSAWLDIDGLPNFNWSSNGPYGLPAPKYPRIFLFSSLIVQLVLAIWSCWDTFEYNKRVITGRRADLIIEKLRNKREEEEEQERRRSMSLRPCSC